MNYYYPEINSTSKAIWVLNAIKETDKESEIIRNGQYKKGIGVFWGLGGYNFNLLKTAQTNNDRFYFTDMPYFNRWLGDNRTSCSWRIIPNALHANWIKDYPDDRFKKLKITVKDWRQKGEHILVCPSSNTINRFYNQQNWLQETIAELKKYTDRPIRIREKPRANGTSGPRAAKISFEDDIKNAWACVTSVSIAGVEAACLGIPVFCSQESACKPIGNFDFTLIESPNLLDRKQWLNNLAYYQYTENELKQGLFKVL